MPTKYLRKEKQVREVWVYFFVCTECKNEYSHLTSVPLKFCNSCRDEKYKKVELEPKFKQTHNRDLSNLINYVNINSHNINYMSIMTEIDLPTNYYLIPQYLNLEHFKKMFDFMPDHWVYVYLARNIPNTSFFSIDKLMGTKSSASRLYHQCFKILKHPKCKRDIFSDFRIKMED